MTLDLPRALEPWRSVLEIFAVEVAPSIGDLVSRLSVLVGPLERDSASARGEPDGVSGIGRRGSFDRLLMSDWALLHEVPDEFLRRAAEQQLSFFEIARREPSADRRSIALFDAGGSQLGGPRVVHLAALVLLAQRALDANARFGWGILHDPTTTIYEGVTPASAFMLLRARRRELATDDDAARWIASLGAKDAKGEREMWLVGGTRTPDPGAAFPHARILADDCLDPRNGNAIEVQVTAPRRPPRAARIEIPPPETSVRLLRDPFEVKKKTQPLGALRTANVGVLGAGATPFVFGTGGKKLFTRGEQGALVTIPVGGYNDGPVRAYLPRTGDAVIAVGQKGKHTIVLSRCAGELVIEGLSRRGQGTRWSSRVRGVAPFDLGRDLAIDPLLELFPLRKQDALLFHGSRLTRIPHSSADDLGGREVHMIAPAYLACRDGASVLVITREDPPRVLRCSIDDNGITQTHPIAVLPSGAGDGKLLLDAVLFAYQEANGAFRIRHHQSPAGPRVMPLPDDEVIGLDTTTSERRLLVVDGARRAVLLVNEAGVRTKVFDVEAGIFHAQVPRGDAHRKDVAILTRDNQLEVRSLEAGGHLWSRYPMTRSSS